MPSTKCIPVLQEFERLQKSSGSGCIPKENTRRAVGCLAKSLRENDPNLQFGDSMRQAWERVNKVKCK